MAEGEEKDSRVGQHKVKATNKYVLKRHKDAHIPTNV